MGRIYAPGSALHVPAFQARGGGGGEPRLFNACHSVVCDLYITRPVMGRGRRMTMGCAVASLP